MKNEIPIICPYCGVGCNLELELDEKGIPVKTSSLGRNKDLNGKYLCIKGFTIHELATNSERLHHPLIRENGKLEKSTWDESIKTASKRLKKVIKKYGPESIGMLCSGKILNEEAYLCQKFERSVIGNNNIDNCARLCHGPSEAGLRRQLGIGAVSTFLDDYDVTETVLVVGAHTTATHPVIWMRLRKHAKEGNFDLVLADPRNTDLAKYATVTLNPRPGTDIYWIKALTKIIFNNNWHNNDFCRNQTLGFNAYIQSIEKLDIDKSCAFSGIKRKDLEKVAELIHNRKTIFIWGMGLTQHAHGTDNVS